MSTRINMAITDSQPKPLFRRVARTRAGKEGQASSKWEPASPHPRLRRETHNAFLSFCKSYLAQYRHKESDCCRPQHIPAVTLRPEESIFLVCGHTESIREFLMNETFPTKLKNSLPLPEEFPNTVNPAFQNTC